MEFVFALIYSMTPSRSARFKTLQAILTRPNPTIRDESTPPRNMRDDPTAIPSHRFEVSHWTEFNFETLMEAYGDILSEPARAINHAPSQPFTIRHISCLKMIGQSYLIPTLRDTIKIGARHIGIQLGRQLPTLEFLPSQPLQGLCPAFTLRSGNQEAILVSCAQYAKQWHSSDLGGTSASAKYPIGRLVTYCRVANTRYGFVLTSSEVVVIRLSESNAARSFQVEWQAIPWDASGDNVLTVNLALWFLSMMSLNEDHRKICRSTELVPLNTWSRSVDPDGQVIYQHHLSMRKRFDLPAGAVYTEV